MPIYNAPILHIDETEVRRYAGLQRVKNFAEKNIRDACEEAILLMEVRGAWESYSYDARTHIIDSNPPQKIIGNSIVKHLSRCDRVICMAVTVGAQIEYEITKKFERGEYLSSVLLDSAATAAVEQAADIMEKNFATQFSKDGYKMRWRYSPGYGDWELFEQAKLFPICGAKNINLRLTEAFMLEPRKSITAIIGLEKISTPQKFFNSHDCANCNKNNCLARK